MEEDLISVIIPVYNVEKYIERCIESITRQTYTNLEIIIIDDGSKDNSKAICQELENQDKRIKVYSQANKGAAAARNYGITKANGEYIGFVDSDDYIELDMYELLLKNIMETNSQLVVCNWFEGDKNNWIKNEKFPTKNILTVTEAFESFYWSMFCFNKLFKKNNLNNTRFSENCGWGEDALFCFNYFNNIKDIALCISPKYYYRKNFNSTTHGHKFKKSFLGFINVLNLEIDYAIKNKLNVVEKKLFEKKLNTTTAWLGIIALEEKPDIESAKILLKFIKKNLFKFLKTTEKLNKKIFVFVACINFIFASRIYKLILKLRVI